MKSRIFIVEDGEGVRELLHDSGSADIEGVAEEALRLGAVGFLVKPFDVYSLLSRIREQRKGEVRTDHIKPLRP
jgi:FixJ family two-component response regulator